MPGYSIFTLIGTVFIVVIALSLMALWGGKWAFCFTLVYMAFAYGIIFWKNRFRPGRRGRLLTIIIAIVGFAVINLIFVISGVFYSDSSAENISSESIFGYYEDGDDQDIIPGAIYTRFHWNSWVPDVVKDWTWYNGFSQDDIMIEQSASQSDRWHAQDCTANGSTYVNLKYEYDMLNVWADEKPTQQQIDAFLKKEKIIVDDN